MRRPLRLLCIVPDLRGGGAERVTIYLMRGLDRARVVPTLCLGRMEGPYLPQVPADVRRIELGTLRGLYAIPKVVRLLRSGDYDLCFSMMGMNLAATSARLVSRARVPLVLGARTPYTPSLLHETRFGRLRMAAIRLLYPTAELVIGVSQGLCDDLVDNFGIPRHKTLAIHNPIEIDAVRAAAREDPHHPWLDGSDPTPTIIAVGGLKIAKDYPLLVDAFARVRARRAARLIILGEGVERPRIEADVAARGLRDDVQLLGFQANPYQFVARATVFALCSRWEGFPNVLTEAMACGTPVVATNCPFGPPEIVHPGKDGLLVPVGDARALADALARLLDDAELRRTLAAEASRRVEEFRAERVVERYERAFEQVAASAEATRS